VEIEELETCKEIEGRINHLLVSKQNWPSIDSKKADRLAETGYRMRSDFSCETICKMWEEALHWRQNRKSPPRCLECGSFFAVVVIPKEGEIANPCGSGTVRRSVTTHAVLSNFPDVAVFDEEGNRIETFSHESWRAFHPIEKL
jgi:hypothetical protein